jgi:outer membrane protein assembly factor BamB
MHKGSAHMHRSFANSLGVAIAAAVIVSGAAWANPVKATFLFNLVEDSGSINSSWATMAWDEKHRELYVTSGGKVRVYNEVGMGIFAFGEDTRFGAIRAATPVDTGDIYALTSTENGWALVQYSYRGEALAQVEIQGAPDDFLEEFDPDTVLQGDGQLFLADRNRGRVLVVGLDGTAARWHDVAPQDGPRGSEPVGIRGFGVDRHGNILFTIPTQFIAGVMSPEGTVRNFGSPGSSKGKFNVAGGIAADEDGRIYVSDLPRAVVSVFDQDFAFVGEFGGRGFSPGSLRAPLDLVVSGNRAFVTQSRGAVKAYGIRIEDPSQSQFTLSRSPHAERDTLGARSSNK